MVFGSVSNIEKNISAQKRIVLQNLKTTEKNKKLQNNLKKSAENIIFSNVAGFRFVDYLKVRELLLVNLHKMNSFRISEDHLDFE